MSTTMVNQKGKLNRSGISRIFQILGTVILFGALLFGCAGRLDWWQAWAFLGIYLAGILANGLWSLTHDPEMINERGQIGANAKSWDKIIGVLYMLLLLGTLVVAGLDARFGWSVMPLALHLAAGAVMVLTMGLFFWVMKANTFLSTFVRIQGDRGQYTVTAGPYRFVRHPMYAGLLAFFLVLSLLLGSWWALIPSVLNMLVMVVRTALEDRMLQAELPGYREYTRKVPYRLVPGLW